MATTIEKTGKTIEDALRAALTELGASESEVEYEVLEKPSKKLFGFLGTSPAKVRVTLKPRPKVEPPPTPPAEPVSTSVVVDAEENISEEVPAPEAISEETLEAPSDQSSIEEDPTENSEQSSAPAVSDDDTSEETVEAASEETLEAPSSESSDGEEPLDPAVFEETVERAEAFLKAVLDKMKLNVKISGHDAEEGYVLSISGDKLGLLIGKRGQTLDAMQYLVNLAANRQLNRRVHFVLDVGGYRQKRAEALKKLAKSLAERVVKMRKEVRLEPMSRYERKVVHLALQNNSKVTTHSVGSEPYRYVIIEPVKPGERKA